MELSVDVSGAQNTLGPSPRHFAHFVCGRPGPGFSPPAVVPNVIRLVNPSYFVLCATPANEETPFAVGHFNSLALCLLVDLGVQDGIVGALLALEANDP